MGKSRSFSIYLLKQGFDAISALKEDHGLDDQAAASSLPNGATLFLLDNLPREPWWKGYFGIDKNLSQVTKGALIFLPMKGRCFALSFGHVYHNLKEDSYEYDFGLRVTLNCVDPNELKSTDTLEPGAARRRRTQVPIASTLTLLDFDRDNDILKRLTGKVKKEYEEFFKYATGASNLRVSSSLSPSELPDLCEKLLELYESSTFKETFPGIQNIVPVRDPSFIDQLNEKLVETVKGKGDHLYLAIPDIVAHEDGLHATFVGEGAGSLYDDLFLERYYEYLESRDVDLADIDLGKLKKHRIALTDENGSARKNYSLFNCLIFDTDLEGTGETYHLNEGDWYKVDDDYVKKLEQYLDPLYLDCALPDYNHDGEGSYNESVAANDSAFLCFDKKNIAPSGQDQVEPCDLFSVEDGHAVLHHVKRSTFSSQLSHLFNQGINSVTLLRLEKESAEKLLALINEANPNGKAAVFKAPVDRGRFRISFAIVTHKPKDGKCGNLPLFSRISLMRIMKDFELMGVTASYGFVRDTTPKTDGRKKPRKKKTGGDEE